MNKSISVQCGIYNTEYRLVMGRNGNVSVKAPYVRWSGQCGTLAHRTIKIGEQDKADILAFFQADDALLEANNSCGALTLDDVLNGHRAEGVHVSI